MAKFKTELKKNEYGRLLRVIIRHSASDRVVSDMDVDTIPHFCGGRIIHGYHRDGNLSLKDLMEAEKLMFAELKKIPVAKLLWTDRTEGRLHTAVKSIYPESEVGSIVRNPNSTYDIIMGEINIKDM